VNNGFARFFNVLPPFARDTFTTFFASIGAFVLYLLGTIVIARTLGPEGKGLYSMALLVPSTISLVGSLGISLANTYFAGSRRYTAEQLASNSLVVGTVLGILLTLAFLAYYFAFTPSFLSGINAPYVVIVAALVPFSLLNLYFITLVLGQGRIPAYNGIVLGSAGISLLVTATALVALRLGLTGVIVLVFLSEASKALITFFVLSRKAVVRWRLDRHVLTDSLRYGLRGHANSIVQLLNSRLDMFMVALFVGVSGVGFYSVAVSAVECINYFPIAVGTVVFARTPGMREDEANRSTPVVCRNTVLVAAVCGVLLAAIAGTVVKALFGRGFVPAVTPLWLLIPGAVSLSVYRVLANDLAGRGRPGIAAACSASGLAVNIVLNLMLIPRLGISGAAVATSCAHTITSISILVIFVRLTHIRPVDVVLAKPEDIRAYWAAMVRFVRQRRAWSSTG
jgi:O-antigen/teichoic acid export membrane protein